MSDKKELPFAIAEILTKYTDDEHMISTSEMIGLLKKEYGMEAERRTIYANVNILKKFGMDISTWQENKEGYYLRTHFFMPEEVEIFSAAVKADKNIPPKRKKELQRKLKSMLSTYQQKKKK